MSLRIFLSSTRGDLDADCRPGALRGVQIGEAVAVEMDTWDAAHGDPVSLCRDMIRRGSSHYLGLFAHRRGWTPAVLGGRSVTEAEYDWALECRRPEEIAVFLPKEGSPLDLELRERACRQAPDDARAQEKFIERVRGRACQPFEDVVELATKVTRRVLFWRGGGLTAMAATAAASAGTRQPSEDELLELGRRTHVGAFERTLELLLSPAAPPLACFLVHGPGGHGHEALLRRLGRRLEQAPGLPPRRETVTLDVPWKGKSPESLTASLVRSLGADPAGASPGVLARETARALEISDVVFEVRRVQWLDGSLPALVRGLWQPLAAALPAGVRHRLLFLATLEQDLPCGWEDLLQEPPADGAAAADFDPGRVVRLPGLAPFTVPEVALWLRRWFPDPTALAQTLVAETAGHPLTLYNRLRDDSLWG